MAPAVARRRGGDGAAVLRQGFAKLYGGGGCVGEGEGGTKGKGKRPSLPPTIYRAKEEGEGAALPLPPRKGTAKGGGVHPPQGTSEVPSPFRTLPSLISWRMGLLGLVPLAHIGQGAPPTAHVAPGAGGPPDPFRHSRYNTDKVRNFSGDQNKTSHI